MTLDRRAYLSICLASVFFMAGSAFILWSRWNALSSVSQENPSAEPVDPAMKTGTGWPEQTRGEPPAPPAPTPPAPPAQAQPPASPAGTPAPSAPAPAAPAPAADKKHNIKFTYRNSRPSKVEIVASFNNWTPLPMSKGENHTWETTVPLEPGEYTYNYLVDGKVVRDPNNPRTAPEGRSLLVVKP